MLLHESICVCTLTDSLKSGGTYCSYYTAPQPQREPGEVQKDGLAGNRTQDLSQSDHLAVLEYNRSDAKGKLYH